jgi:hypothetical protein
MVLKSVDYKAEGKYIRNQQTQDRKIRAIKFSPSAVHGRDNIEFLSPILLRFDFPLTSPRWPRAAPAAAARGRSA